ncbi:MAG: hypothetical protein RLZZ501_648, partial [Pseudomonadota bacterium]
MTSTPPRLPKTPLLDRIAGPEDFRGFSI